MLGWRTIDLRLETHDVDDFQGCSVINYADADVPWTRVCEFRHFHPARSYGKQTVIAREYSRSAGEKDDPFYPVNLAEDKRRYAAYRELAWREEDVYFGGRLGSYRYLDMHQAIGGALMAWEKHLRPRLAEGAPLQREAV